MGRHHNRAVRKEVYKLDKNNDVVVEKAVEDTTQTSSPQVEVPSTKEQTTQEQVDQPVEEQVSDVESEVKDPREYQIKRLAEENKRLKSERQGSAFDALRPQAQPVQGVNVDNYKDVYGEVNWNAYNASVNTYAQQVASVEADRIVNERLDEQQARTKHPELFADEEVEREIADRWLAAKMRGENVSITDIADRVAKRTSKDVSRAEKRGAEKILQEVETKEQAGLSASGQTSQGARAQESLDDLDELSQQTRIGNDDAIVARLKNIPWANK
jgi:hypothetical protein